ncbi:GNAT family N-acetyltransferase [uncultured Phenylobacterium sp.]|uniref:GNAT family N-acetyltransferase n=1 Tax=uncultured Phenylobacterium sp. TaxID=349273 RepID=UPI0025F3C355|nr:GNAT family N-acetyltransferase [uncultured Phenylobacterium sp.]
MDESEALIRLCGRALVAQMGDVPGVELHLSHNSVLGLTGEPLADFNMLTLGPDLDAEDFFVRSIARARARGLPLLATLSPQVAPAIAPVATALGLTYVGMAPLMVLRADTPLLRSPSTKVSRALGTQLVGIAGDLAAAAFDAPRDAIARCIDVGLTATSGVETYIAWDGDQPMSAVSVTPIGNTAGISLMATWPAQQRKGHGRSLLTQVMQDFRGRGVQRFYLSATEAGRPLYASLGFEVVADLSAWILSGRTP